MNQPPIVLSVGEHNDAVRQIIVGRLSYLMPEQLGDDFRLEKDGQADQLDALEIVMDLEEQLHIDITDQMVEDMIDPSAKKDTVGNVIAMVELAMKNKIEKIEKDRKPKSGPGWQLFGRDQFVG
jgi:acyl carrier protein